MSEIRYAARSGLHDPVRFLAEAWRDLETSFAIGWRLFVSNVRVRYRRSLLGYLWLLLPALGTTVVCVYLQSRRIVHVAPTELPYGIHVLAGIILWQVFIEALNAPLQQLTAGQQMITRSRVPHEALILAGAIELLLGCAVRMAVLAAVLVAYQVVPGATVLLVPLGVLGLALLGLALGLLAAPWGLLYEDVGRAMVLFTSFLFFLTPVVYAAPGGGVVSFNPVTPLLDSTRSWLTGAPTAASGFLIVTALTLAALVVAWLFHRLARPHVIVRLG